MSQSQMKQTFRLLEKPGGSFADYYKTEVKSCREQLSYAVENAAKDQNGKPVFYTICRHVSASGMSRTISVHYFDTATGGMRHTIRRAARPSTFRLPHFVDTPPNRADSTRLQ